MQNYTPKAPREMRFRWYRLVEQDGKPVQEICGLFGISRKTYYKWYRRDHGLGSNQYKNRKEHPHRKLTPKAKVFIVSEKQKYNYGPEKMRLRLKEETGIEISSIAIYKFMKKKQLIRKPQKKQKWYTPMKEPFMARCPGENVQIDVKYVPGRDAAWAYQFRFIDTATNMQYAKEALVRDAKSAIWAFESAKRYLPFEINGIQTDNGSEFRGLFHEYVVRRGIVHRFIPKRSAPWNGKVERANRSVDDEFYLNMGKPWRTLHAYTYWYNNQRPHLGKGMNGVTPYQKFVALTT